jgi:hypothetical protein
MFTTFGEECDTNSEQNDIFTVRRNGYAVQRRNRIAVIACVHDRWEQRMELRHLEHFLAVAEDASFTRAAPRIHLVQSSLSVSVRSLERELGVALFDRTTHSVERHGRRRGVGR